MTLPLEIDVAAVKRLQDEQADFLLLDCREPHEHQTASIPGATLLPMSQLTGRVQELDSHRDRHIVVHCHHGARSLQVADWLARQGFQQVQSMAGGIDAWSLQVDTSIPRY